MHVGMQIDGARVDIGRGIPFVLIMQAFDLKMHQIQGPEWMLNNPQGFDILATLPEGAKPNQVPEMATVTPTGGFVMNMRPQAGAKGIGNIQMKMDAPKPGASPMDMKMTMEIEARMDAFAGQLSALLDKPVVDMTELRGGYKVPLEMGLMDLMAVSQKLGAGTTVMNLGPMGGEPGAGPVPVASDPGAGTSLKDSVQKLGLRLESRKLPIDVMVIDHIEKSPTDN
jgi:uncharacterized protein (TIGR03435 family)